MIPSVTSVIKETLIFVIIDKSILVTQVAVPFGKTLLEIQNLSPDISFIWTRHFITLLQWSPQCHKSLNVYWTSIIRRTGFTYNDWMNIDKNYLNEFMSGDVQ